MMNKRGEIFRIGSNIIIGVWAGILQAGIILSSSPIKISYVVIIILGINIAIGTAGAFFEKPF